MVLSGSYRFTQDGRQTAFLEKTGKLSLLDEVGQLEIFPTAGDYLREVAKQKPSVNESDMLEQLSNTLGNYQQTELAINKKEQKVLDPMAKSSAATKKAAKKEAPAKKAASNGKEPAEMNDCICGCGEQCRNNFRPGHDARVHGWAKKVASGELKIGSLPPSAQKYIKQHASS